MRIDADLFNEFMSGLLRHKRRSFLTGFGVFWGIFMLLALVGGGAGLKVLLNKNFEGFATNSAFLWSNSTTKPYKGMKEGRYWSLRSGDVDYLKRMIPELDIVTGVNSEWAQVAENGINTVNCNLKGVFPEYSGIEVPQLKYGRSLNQADLLGERKVCVLGKKIYTSLFPEGGDPCGERIKIGPVRYTVIGVNFASGNVSIQGQADESVLVPMPVLQKVYHRGDEIEVLAMTAKEGLRVTALEPRLRQLMAHRHTFDPSDTHALFVINSEQMFSIIDNLFKGLDFLIWIVGLGTILAGAIGVSNITMVSVRKRTVEIGIRRAIGATPFEILFQIIVESVTLTVISGLLGIMFTVWVLNIVATASEIGEFLITLRTALLALLLLSLLGVAAGMPPALRAMKIRPVEAMRDE